MTEIIKILEIIAWPLTAIFGIILFKKELNNVFKRLNKVETSNAKIHFDKEIEIIEKNLTISNKKINNDNNDWFKDMLQIAYINPRAAIIEAWTSIEIACVELGMIQGSAMKRFSPKALEDFLYNSPNFSEEMVKRIMDLRRLRNKVAHGIDADFEFIDAKKYLNLADYTLQALQSIS